MGLQDSHHAVLLTDPLIIAQGPQDDPSAGEKNAQAAQACSGSGAGSVYCKELRRDSVDESTQDSDAVSPELAALLALYCDAEDADDAEAHAFATGITAKAETTRTPHWRKSRRGNFGMTNHSCKVSSRGKA